MLGAGEAAMKIEGTWFLENVDDYFGESGRQRERMGLGSHALGVVARRFSILASARRTR